MTSLRMRAMLAVALVAIACRPEPAAPSSTTVPVVEGKAQDRAEPLAAQGPELVHLGGSIDAGGGIKLEYFAVLERGADGKYSGKLDIPMQGARGVALDGVEVTDTRIVFTLPSVKAKWIATAARDGVLACNFEQMGVSLPCRIERLTPEALATATAPKVRPQTPKPPFPYEAVEVAYDNAEAGVHLAGTLTIPPGEGRVAAALLVTGSGAQDRDETIVGHKPFLVLADHLSRNGIAVLRVDDRGVGGTSAGKGEATSADFEGDVLAGVRFLASHPRIDPARIGLIGHSEGGMIAPAVAAKNRKSVAFVVMLAGPGVRGDDLLVEQVGAIARATGASEEQVAAAKAKQREVVDVIVRESDLAKAEEQLKAILKDEAGEAATVGPEVGIKVLLSPWFRHFMQYDPRPALKRVKCPVLVLNGELDRQVLADQNVPAIEKALKAGGNRRVTVHRLAGLNHLFQPAKTGGIDEYERIEQTIDPKVLEIVSSWILAEVPARK